MRPRKSLGQHFLHDRNVIGRILDAVAPREDQHFVEIGPGRGALTLPLLDRVRRLDVIEIDRMLAAELRRLPADGRLLVHEQDALAFDFGTIATDARRLRLVGNLPYNISTPLLFHLLETPLLFDDLHVMLQREVVERMTAAPGSRRYGRLTVALAARCRVQSLFIVRPGAFNPPPQVDSAVARLVPDATLAERILAPHDFDRLLGQAFSMRRKRLSNSLAGLLEAADIEACGIDPGLRPEAVPPEGFVRLANRLSERSSAAGCPAPARPSA